MDMDEASGIIKIRTYLTGALAVLLVTHSFSWLLCNETYR